MENKRLATFVVMMLTIGNLIVESEGLEKSSSQNTVDYLSCLELCITTLFLRDKLPVKCAEQCWKPPPEMNCKMGCVTHRCVSIENHSKFFCNNHKLYFSYKIILLLLFLLRPFYDVYIYI